MAVVPSDNQRWQWGKAHFDFFEQHRGEVWPEKRVVRSHYKMRPSFRIVKSTKLVNRTLITLVYGN